VVLVDGADRILLHFDRKLAEAGRRSSPSVGSSYDSTLA